MTNSVLPTDRLPGRRQILAAAGLGAPTLGLSMWGFRSGLVATAHAQGPQATHIFPESPHVTVAGPDGGELDQWSRTLIPTLSSYLSPNVSMRRSLAGGVDGITGTNQFTAQASPDGVSALLTPGTAVLAWQRGDSRVQFDLTRFTPLLNGLCATIIAGRINRTQLVPGQKLRIAVSGPNGPEQALILGLAQLGLQPIPVDGMVDRDTTSTAFAQHAVDLFMWRGPTTNTILSDLGARPICVLGLPNGTTILERDPQMPELPHLAELLHGMPADPLTEAWQASAVAAQLAFTLLLPQLTTSPLVDVWRRAIDQTIGTPELLAAATTQATKLQGHPATIHAKITDAGALTPLRDWHNARSRR